MTFRVGQKVVFVGGANRGNNCVVRCGAITRGQVYTVRDVDNRYTPFFGAPWIRLQEFSFNSVTWYGEQVEPAFDPLHFRPVVERKTDISFAHEILRKATKPARSPAITLQQH